MISSFEIIIDNVEYIVKRTSLAGKCYMACALCASLCFIKKQNNNFYRFIEKWIILWYTYYDKYKKWRCDIYE